MGRIIRNNNKSIYFCQAVSLLVHIVLHRSLGEYISCARGFANNNNFDSFTFSERYRCASTAHTHTYTSGSFLFASRIISDFITHH